LETIYWDTPDPGDAPGLTQADDGGVEALPAGGAAELGVAVVEDAAIQSHEPVALPRRCHPHADHRLGEVEGPGRAEEPGVAVVEDPAVAGHEPVAVTGRAGRHPDDRLVEVDRPGGA